jgi:GTP cyclohydrolase I
VDTDTFDLARAEAAMAELLGAFGMEPDEHTARTPARAAKAWQAALAGYSSDPRQHLDVTFPVTGEAGLVIVSGIHVQAVCAHHLLPITGRATVAYRPHHLTGRVVGLSKLARVVEGYARRLTVQEQLGEAVATALQEVLQPVGAACIVSAEHGCMTMRGIQQRGTLTTTEAATGEWNSPMLLHSDLAAARAAHERS